MSQAEGLLRGVLIDGRVSHSPLSVTSSRMMSHAWAGDETA